jgi:hypothetical protein
MAYVFAAFRRPINLTYVQRADQSLLSWLLDTCDRERLPGFLKAGLVEVGQHDWGPAGAIGC